MNDKKGLIKRRVNKMKGLMPRRGLITRKGLQQEMVNNKKGLTK